MHLCPAADMQKLRRRRFAMGTSRFGSSYVAGELQDPTSTSTTREQGEEIDLVLHAADIDCTAHYVQGI